MAVVTMQGQIGSGGQEVGLRVANLLGYDYIDRLVFAQAARMLGATVQAVANKEHELRTTKDKISSFVHNLLERSAMAGAGSEPYFGPGIEVLLSKDYYSQEDRDPITTSSDLDIQQFVNATSIVIKELAEKDNVVIVGRGANIILADHPNSLHVDIIAPVERRVKTIMTREHLDETTANKFVEDHEIARISFFRKAFDVDPLDSSLYHMILNMDHLKTETAAEIVAHAAQDITYQIN
jgi:cytidylate kinase